MKLIKSIKKKTGKEVNKVAPAAKRVAAKRPTTKVRPAPRSKTAPPAAPSKASVAPRQEVTTEVIAARAYTLWEQAGRPAGRDMEYWLQAESQLKQDTQSFAA
jgi:hypothetical protein